MLYYSRLHCETDPPYSQQEPILHIQGFIMHCNFKLTASFISQTSEQNETCVNKDACISTLYNLYAVIIGTLKLLFYNYYALYPGVGTVYQLSNNVSNYM